ncbi:nucleotide kinase domain-containing protein [Limobrevibacterium gyesilva]|uniref:DNA base hypermodification protein n=1 Tax=Limobrevibacterium gyesilva TaxID=2991712 RepID=A0AA42CHC2_9PROT|nr:nucleotide kinase domain-containing protein [Limobrevibacterium gyesilva]MCW3474695.1 putative DNA base hypermodification protein [Limobrevibacterium gyesilva]
MDPTPVFNSYWRFAAERQAMFFRRLSDPVGPWTDDPVLAMYRFTNAYRASDRVSQYLIREVQYHPDRPATPPELFFRTLLFKLFNRVETWEALERQLGPIVWETTDLNAVARTLDELMAQGKRIYSAAYIMPAPAFGHPRKHANHLALLAQMMEDRLPERVRQAPTLRVVYEQLARYSGIGRFLAFQYTIDLNYSTLLTRSEDDFVVAGPGALDGIAKCFSNTGGRDAEAVIFWACDQQERAFAAANLAFSTLYGRRLKPIDCQNLFCEISKYARVAHPDHPGLSGRTRIKQSYRRDPQPLPVPMYPPRWGLKVGDHETAGASAATRRKMGLLL